MVTVGGVDGRQGALAADEQRHDHLREQHHIAQRQKRTLDQPVAIFGHGLVEEVAAEFGEQLREVGELGVVKVIHRGLRPIVERPND